MTGAFRWGAQVVSEDEIAVAVLVRQALPEVDTTPLWQYDFPRVAANQEAQGLARHEAKTGRSVMSQQVEATLDGRDQIRKHNGALH